MRARDLAEQLRRLPVQEAMRSALARSAARLQDAVAEALSAAPGGEHDAPWLRTGALRASISQHVDALDAVVGSNSDVAEFQERGTARVPPRPFLAPAAARMAPELARAIGAEVAAAVGGRVPDEH